MGAAEDQRRVEPGGEVEVAMDPVVLPEGLEDEARLVLLDRQHGVPASSTQRCQELPGIPSGVYLWRK
jgi:hypothetical protein